MSLRSIYWGKAIVALVICYAVMVAAAFAWVAIYSHVLNPGQPLTHYRAYANVAAPWVALVTGVPTFLLVTRWLTRKSTENPLGTVLAMFVIYLALETMIVTTTPSSNLSPLFMVTNFVLKGLATAFGYRLGMHGKLRSI